MKYELVITARQDDVAVVTLDEVKKDLDVDFSDDDSIIQNHISAAISWIEEHASVYLQPVTITLVAGPPDKPLIRLPGYPIRSVTSFIVDLTPVLGFRTLSGNGYSLLPPIGAPWPLTVEYGGTQIIYEAGYLVGTVPAGLKSIIKAIVGIFYNKPTGNELTAEWNAIERVVSPYRRRSL